MLKKKNYKDDEHFSQYYNVSVALSNGRKVAVYYKRYRPKTR